MFDEQAKVSNQMVYQKREATSKEVVSTSCTELGLCHAQVRICILEFIQWEIGEFILSNEDKVYIAVTLLNL